MRQKFIAYSKFILSGEHSVLRGAEALVFPIKSRYITLEFDESDVELSVEFAGTYGEEARLAFFAVLEEALKQVGRSRNELKGELLVTNEVPIGAGLGASACLCVVVAKWFVSLNWMLSEQIFGFAKTLENLFHGESSGVDVAVALKGEPISFSMTGRISALELNWTPNFYLSYTGQKGMTSDCVKQVKALYDKDQAKAEELDAQMCCASEMAKSALLDDEEVGVKKLSEAMRIAEECFIDWGLSKGVVSEHIEDVKNKGALAAKPTGSGGGGFILSLWQEPQQTSENFFSPN